MNRALVLWDWHTPTEDIINTSDGPLATFRELSRRLNLSVCVRSLEAPFSFSVNGLQFHRLEDEGLIRLIDETRPDFLFCWGSLDRPWHRLVQEKYPEIPKGLRFSGGPQDSGERHGFRTIFCESPSDEEEFLNLGHTNIVHASACDIGTFQPRRGKKIWKAVYPTSFCTHKRIELFADVFAGCGLVCGRWNDLALVQYCQSRSVHAWPRISSLNLSYLYQAADFSVATGGMWGGSQRMVLESMACNIPPVVAHDNPRCHSYIKESGFGYIVGANSFGTLSDLEPQKPTGRDYVLSKYTPAHYADLILAHLGASDG